MVHFTIVCILYIVLLPLYLPSPVLSALSWMPSKTILPLNVIIEFHSAGGIAGAQHVPNTPLGSGIPQGCSSVYVRKGGQCSKLYIFGNCVTLKLLSKQNFILKLPRNIFTECVGISLLLEPAPRMGAYRKSHHLVWVTVTELGMCIIKILMRRKKKRIPVFFCPGLCFMFIVPRFYALE